MTYYPPPQPAASTSLTSLSSVLGADVTITVANAYTDGLSLALTAGTWLVLAFATILNSGGAGQGTTLKLWDGTTVYASGEGSAAGGVIPVQMAIQALVVTAGPKTVKISAAVTAGTTSKFKAAAIDNGAGNNATQIVAVRIA